MPSTATDATASRVARAAAEARRLRLARPTPLDVIQDEFVPGVRAMDQIVTELLDGLEGIGSIAAADLYLAEKRARLDIGELRRVMYRASLRAQILGAEDAAVELVEGEPVAVETFERIRLDKPPIPPEFITSGKLNPKPFDEAIEAFKRREIVTKDAWLAMTERAKTESFTVAYLSTEQAIEVMRDEITRSLTDANFDDQPVLTDLRAYRKRLEERMRSAGFLTGSPDATTEIARLTPSHVETVFRNGVMGAYSDGRRSQMSQPHVKALRPYWQVVTVNDGPPRQRETHQAVHGWVMLADDPGWASTFPPFGHRCRCRVVARSARWVEQNAPKVHTGPLPDLPDKGWVTRAAPPMPAPEALPLPAPSPAAPAP